MGKVLLRGSGLEGCYKNAEIRSQKIFIIHEYEVWLAPWKSSVGVQIQNNDKWHKIMNDKM
jgi:hypothetical protein